jgi:hypothetical protein
MERKVALPPCRVKGHSNFVAAVELHRGWPACPMPVPLAAVSRAKRSFLSRPSALRAIKGLGRTKPHDKTFAVLGGFCHAAA